MPDPSDWAAPGQGQRQPEPGQAAQHTGPGFAPDSANAPKPGVIPLRPLGVSEILDGAISFIRSNPKVTLGLSAVVITITQLIQIPVTQLVIGRATALGTDPTRPPSADEVIGFVGPAIGGFGLSAFVSFIAITILTGLLIVALGQAVLGKKASFGEAWAGAKGRIAGLLGLSLLTSLILVAVLAAGFVPLVITLLVDASPAVSGIAGVVGVLAAICVGIFLAVSWWVITPAYVLEGIPAMTTFRRSYRLVRPRWWRVFGVVLLAGIITAVIAGILAMPFALVAGVIDGSMTPPTDGQPAAPSLLGTTLTALGTIIASTITSPFSAGVAGLLYIDQRIRREAFDLELLRAAQSPKAALPPDASSPDPQR